MKHLLCALAVLVAGCGAASATDRTAGGGTGKWTKPEITTPHLKCEQRGNVEWCDVIVPDDNMLPDGYSDPCRTLMEAAMRAMDEFVGDDNDVVLSVYVKPADRLRKEANRIERHEKALEQWKQAKAQCWKK